MWSVKTPDRSLFSEIDNALPIKLIHSSCLCGVVLVLSASAASASLFFGKREVDG